MSATQPPAVLWRAQPGPQTWLISCPIGDIFFGGGRGGGKTDGMIADWLAHQAAYGQHARGVWFRRSLPEIEAAQSRMLPLFSAVGAVYNGQKSIWRFPSGATLRLRYLETDRDAARYQGGSYTWLGFDELPTWRSPAPVDMLRATLRSAEGVPTRMVSTGNPGGAGHAWVKARYVTAAPPMTPFVGEDGTSRVFIPSLLADNVALMTADPGYVDKLKASGPPWLVRAWLDGDWDAALQGELIKAEWLQRRWLEMPRRREWGRVIVSVDTAIKVGKNNDFTAMLVAVEIGSLVYLVDVVHAKLEFPDLCARLRLLCEQWSPHTVLIEDKGSGQSLIQQLESDGFRWPIIATNPTADKVTRMFVETPALEAGRVLLPANAAWAERLVDECLTFPLGAHDDQVDALSQLLRYLREGVDLLALYGS